MSRFALVFFLVGGLCDCAPHVKVVRGHLSCAPPTHPATVRVFLDEASAPPRYQELGLVIANTHIFVPVMISLDAHLAVAAQRQPRGNQVQTAVFRSLVRRAAQLGADGVIVKSFSRSGAHLTISAVAIRTVL